jgi:thiol:disulfide interchange protein DsbA
MPTRRTRSALIAVLALLCAMSFAVATAANPAAAAKPAAAPVEGTDYVRIDHPAPIHGAKVEVVEVFGYGCPICDKFQPSLVAWEKKMPAYVQFSYVPAPFGDDEHHCWDDFARAFYAAQALGVQVRSHDAIYKEVFEQNRLTSCAAIPSLYTDFGIDAKTMAGRMQAFDVTGKLNASHDTVLTQWNVEGTPTVVIDGTWRAALTQAGPEALLRTMDWLIARQRPLHKGH